MMISPCPSKTHPRSSPKALVFLLFLLIFAFFRFVDIVLLRLSDRDLPDAYTGFACSWAFSSPRQETAMAAPRRRNDQTFRQTEVSRMIRAAKKQHVSKYEVVSRLDSSGKTELALVVCAAPTEQNPTTELDEWLNKKKK